MPEARKIGRYVIKEVLGEGAMGSVFKAYDPSLERWVAIKTVRTSNINDPVGRQEFRERFLQESRANGRLNHPNVVSIYDCGVHDNDPFLVMEFIRGTPLDAYIKEHVGERLSFCLPILEQIASGLDYAHEEEVIHRDIKPGNILVTTTKLGRLRAKIVDFGLAKLQDSTLTQAGSFLGTPRYASPEQIITGKVTAQSDIYALGTVAYEMLTAQLPYRAESMHAIMYHIANEPPKLDFSGLPETMDHAQLKAIFERVFKKTPSERYQTASAFVSALKPLLTGMKAPASLKSRAQKEADFIDLQLEKALGPAPKAKKKPTAPSVEESVDLLIKHARQQFQQAVKTKNVDRGLDCLMELERLNADVNGERKKLNGLRAAQGDTAPHPKQPPKPATATPQKTAKPLGQPVPPQRKAAATGITAAPTRAPSGSRPAPAPSVENEKVRSIRERFSRAARNLDVPACRELIRYLVHLQADTHQEQKILTSLEMQIQADEAKKIKASIILNTRAKFQQAILNKDPELGTYYLKELKQVVEDLSSEEQALKDMIRRKRDDETAEIKKKIVNRLTDQFRKALEAGNYENCRYYVRELSQVDREVGSHCANELELGEKETAARRDVDAAVARDDFEAAHAALEILETLGAETSEEKKKLRKLDPDGSRSFDSASAPGLADVFKDEITQDLRVRFRKAANSGSVEDAKQILKQLQELDVDISSESKALGLLE